MADSRPHNIQIRLSDTGLSWLDRQTRDHHVTRSDVVREALYIAARYESELRQRLQVLGEGF